MRRDKFGLSVHGAATGRAGGGDKVQSHTFQFQLRYEAISGSRLAKNEG